MTVLKMENHRISAFTGDRLQGNQTTLDVMAIDVYIYGYPLVLLDVTRRLMLANGLHPNQFLNEPIFPTPQYTTIVRPNVDTLYSMAWLDLSQGPVILVVPDTHGRYYLMELLDAWSNVFASIGARTTGTYAGAYAITGPEWNGILPEGVIRVGAPANTVWVIGRTQTNGPEDYPNVHPIQKQYALIPASDWGKPEKHHSNHTTANQIYVNPADLVAGMDAVTFFRTMMTAMAMNPPWIEDPQMNQKLTAFGLIPAKNFSFQNLSPPVEDALRFAATHGPGIILAEAAKKFRANNINGWTWFRKNIGFYGADYLQRAVIAMTGVGANLPQDSVYATAFTDAAGQPLTGYYNYVIHFHPEELPPVNAFWSITLYNEKGYLAENHIHRYAVSPHFNQLHYNRDGSLNILVGRVPPRKEVWNNWLPSPIGPFNLLLRMYWPKEPVLNGSWTPPAIQLIG